MPILDAFFFSPEDTFSFGPDSQIKKKIVKTEDQKVQRYMARQTFLYIICQRGNKRIVYVHWNVSK